MENKIQPVELFRPFTRHNGIPVDITSIFYSLEEARQYAAAGTIAYPGQVISVLYPVELKIEMYVIAYNTTNSSSKYILKDLATGTSGTGSGNISAFNYIGRYTTLDSIKKLIASPGDLCYIIENQNYYIYNGSAWDAIELFSQYASKTSDGIITAAEYSTLINETNMAGVYYNPGTDNITDNTWLEVATTEGDSLKSSIPTLNTVLHLIETKSDVNRPSIKLISEIPVDVYYEDSIRPKFTLIYNKKYGGSLNYVEIYREDPQSGKNMVVLLYASQFTLNNDGTLTYLFEDTYLHDEYTGILNSTLKYYVYAHYYKNEIYAESYATSELTYSFYDSIDYGFIGSTNTHDYSTVANKDTLKMTIPSGDIIIGIYFIVPNNKLPQNIYFSSQSGIDMLDLFTSTDYGSTKTKYSYILSDSDGFSEKTYFNIIF